MKNYDPKLRECMAHIEAILKAYDCGGFVGLHSKTHGEFKLFAEGMTWSNLRFLKDGEAVHIKLHSKTDKENTEATVAMIFDMQEMAAMLFSMCHQMKDAIERQVKVAHIPLGKRINNEGR